MKPHQRHFSFFNGVPYSIMLLTMCAALFCFGLTSVYAQPDPRQNLKQVTSHPAEDLEPCLSPDGKWLAFVSKRAGNYDIWLKNIQTGSVRRLTKHRADEFHPVWESNQDYLVYVSQQSDAHGDLYRLNLRNVDGELIPKGEPERLTIYMGFDGYPSMSKNNQNIAWVSDRTGRPEIWLMTKRRQQIRQLTHGGATHPAWSPKQDYLAFTSFRDGAGNGDIWLLNLYAASELFERKTPLDSLERAMWPITKGPAVDGFPTWSDDASTVLFSRHDYDTNGDGRLSPADNATLWSVNVRHLPKDSTQAGNPSFDMVRDTFNDRIAVAASPVSPLYYDARQASWDIDSTVYFVSSIKGKTDIYKYDSPDFFLLPDSFTLGFINENFPLPRNLNSTQLDSLSAIRTYLSDDEKKLVWDRWTALHQVIDGTSDDPSQLAQALYEAGLCLTILTYGDRARFYFEYVLNNFPHAAEQRAWSELVLRTLQGLPPNADHRRVVDELINSTGPLQLTYAAEPAFLAQTDMLLGNLYYAKGDFHQAQKHYRRIQERYSQYPAVVAQSLYRLGVVLETSDETAAFEHYIAVLKNYPQETEWAKRAQNRLLQLAVKKAKTDRERVELYRLFHARLRDYNADSVEPLFRAATLLTDMRQYDDAFAQYDSIAARYADDPESVFAARLRQANLLVKTGEIVDAWAAYQKLITDNAQTAPARAQQARDRLVDVLLASAADLKRSKNWVIARLRYEQALALAPFNIQAHQGYVESLFQLGLAEQAVQDYEQLKKKEKNNKVILYALGLAYSYRGTPQRNNVFMPGDVIPDDLEKSNSYLRQAMSQDYNLIEAYLALSYNYEMLENNLNWEKNKPRNFWQKAGEAIAGPFVWTYHTLTFYNETKAPRYYENSIQVLTSALSLNDETERPDLEAQIALNMANSYYNVGEFGFAKAYEFYHLRMQYDSTFTDAYQETLMMERMGHCAMVVVDAERGPAYLLRAIELYNDRNDRDRVLVNTKRLALLYEFAEDSRNALVYYQQAADMEQRRRLYDGLLRSYRSLAYHHHLLNQPEEAVFYANKGLALLDDGLVDRSEGKSLFPQIGILGIHFPIPYDLRRVGAKSSVLQLSTDEEEAILYSVLAATLQNDGQYQRAISFFEKKLDIYTQRFDYEAQAIFKNNIAYLYFLQGDYDKAWWGMTEAYWFARRKTKSVGVQLLNVINAGHVFLAMANEPDESKQIKLEARHNWILTELNEMLRRTSTNAGLYAQSRMHLYMLRADVYMTDVFTKPAGDMATNIPAAYRVMQNAAQADTSLALALDIARDKGLVQDECAILLKRGKTRQKLGLLHDAADMITKSLNLARQVQNNDVLWRANTAMGLVLTEIKSKTPDDYKFDRQPLYYFQEAVKVSQRNMREMPGYTAAHRRHLIQEPYRQIIHIYAQQGQTDGALALAERMREQHYFDMWRDDPIDLGGRRQNLFITLDSLYQEMSGLELTLQKISNPMLSQRLAEVKTEYNNLLVDMRREAPEVEQFIYPLPVTVSELQNRLPDSLALVYHIAADTQSLFWIISRDSVTFESVPMNKLTALQQLEDGRLPMDMQRLFDGMSTDIVFVPDYDFLIYPWTQLAAAATPASPIVSISSSLTSFAYALQNTRPRGQTLYMAGESSMRRPENYVVLLPISQHTGDAAEIQAHLLARADVIHLNVWANWNWMTSTSSSIQIQVPESQPVTFAVRDFYTLTTSASHLSMNIMNSIPPDPDAFIAWERAAIFSGMASLMFSSNAALDSTGLFYSRFYQNMINRAAAYSFQDAVGILPLVQSDFAFLQFVGSAATATEHTRTLAENTDYAKKQADAAFSNQEWHTALQLYSQLKGAAQTEAVLINRLSSALNMQQWDEAALILQERIKTQERLNNWQAVADAYRQLYVLNDYQNKKQPALNASTNYQRLVREYGLEYDVATAWDFLASLLYDGESYAEAIQFYSNAAATYQAQNNAAGQISAQKRIGDIYARHLGDVDSALNAYDVALTAAKKAGDIQSQAELLIEKSQTCLWFSLYLLADEFVSSARILAQELNDVSLLDQCFVLCAHISFGLRDVNAALACLDSVNVETESSTSIDALLCQSRILIEQDHVDAAEKLILRATEMADRLRSVTDQEKCYDALAVLNWYRGDFTKALDATKRTLLLINGHYKRANLIAAAILIDMNEISRAEQHLQNIASALQKHPDDKTRAYFYYLESRAAVEPQAGSWAEMAVSLADSLTLSELAWRVDWWRAQRAVADNDLEAAGTFYQNALLRLNRSVPKSRYASYESGLSALEGQFFADLVNFYIRLGKINSALNAAEMSHQRTLDRQHNWTRHAFYHTETRFNTRDSLRQALAQQRISLLLHMKNNLPVENEQIEKIDRLQLRLLQQRLSDAGEQHNSSAIGDSIDVQLFAATVPDDALVLRTFYDENSLHSWVISRDSVYYIQAPFDIDTLRHNVNELHISLDSRDSTAAPAAALYASLLGPVADRLALKNTLVILPFGDIVDVPFALLGRRGMRPLGLEKQLIYATRLPHSFSDLPASPVSIGAVASPNAPSALALSENVAKRLQRYFPTVALYTKDNFVDVNALPSMRQHDAVYIGATLKINSRFPYDVDVMSPFDHPQNSVVFEKWLAQLSTLLLVLHSKQSVGSTYGDVLSVYDGILNTSRMLAAPQWTPDELAGSVLIKRFFFYMSEGHTVAEALRLAQNAVYDQIDNHPSAWAAFRLFGDFTN